MRNDTDYVASFESGTIDPATFTHKNHVAVAYHILSQEDFLSASIKYTRCIKQIVRKAGAPEKFNTTITLAFLSLIAERMNHSPSTSYEEFISNNTDLLDSKVLHQWYSHERLHSDMARTTFLLPNLA